MNNDIFNYFEDISKDIMHSDSTYYNHCTSIYKILKKIKQPEHVCLAGLFHSVYSTEYFQIKNPPSRNDIKTVIGAKAENLVYIFCNLRDRHNIIINNSFSFENNIHHALVAIEYANLKEQSDRIDDKAIHSMCNDLLSILSISNSKISTFEVGQKKIWVFDDLLENNESEFLNEYCLNSLFVADHSSNNELHYSVDSRFVANMTENDLIDSGIIPKIKDIATFINEDIFIGKYYINHYGLMTGVSKHTDSSFSDHYTMLIFCNKYWDETWGGEIAFYDDDSEAHTIFNFKPKRILLFDSRIAHKVMPMTRNAQKDRFTLAIKCATQDGVENLKKQYTNIVGIGK